ncbi:Methyltransferase type 11 [Denitrovibrio acetiphilus DSM 12809]|uniref:Methyltransferase type 11 n=1 Tax=Denitrovibrio acetiphilus (strain DSM 12809 / NBRC 114555 / N2460) TaxID=522772 RepID=D4H651_DENA2|nr:class I SAM-dependent methyltransferase [Denitrovibrio acetiphilus]ADD67697.1 Methyltransferase type 11 [Denitrovibrio acetiphilus DSM 12809]
MEHVAIKQKEFWNGKAQVFPRYEPCENNYEARMLNIAKKHGVDFTGQKILDVGCGTGMYTIRLAQEAASVLGTDISEEMLDILNTDAKRENITNLRTVLTDWKDFETDERFDLIFCSMTPAVHDNYTREKLFKYTDRWLIFMGFAGVMQSDVMAEVYRHHGVTQRKFNNGKDMEDWLVENKREFTAYPVEGEWVQNRHAEGMAVCCRNMLSSYDVEMDESFILSHIENFKNSDGSYTERIKYKIEMIICEI